MSHDYFAKKYFEDHKSLLLKLFSFEYCQALSQISNYIEKKLCINSNLLIDEFNIFKNYRAPLQPFIIFWHDINLFVIALNA